MAAKLNVVLDIDETFVHYLKKAKLAEIPSNNSDKYDYEKTSAGAFVLRPYLKEFLEYLFDNCTVSLWTWSEKEYAEGMADIIYGLVKKRPAHIFHDIHAEKSGGPLGDKNDDGHGQSKDLNMLWYGSKAQHIEPIRGFHECNTILIDDLPSNSVNSSNRKNSITIAPFALFGEVKDRSDPYHNFVDDRCLIHVKEILQRIIPKLHERCTGDMVYENIFSADNIEYYGLEEFVKRVRLHKYRKVGGKKVPDGYTTIKAIAVPGTHAELISGGRRRTYRAKKTVRKTHKTRRHRRHRH